MVERLILARHGESECSRQRIVNGDPSAACPLTARGRAQAAALGVELRDRDLAACAVTEFARTQETAEIALAGRDVGRLSCPGLNDPPAGCFEGRSADGYLGWRRTAGLWKRPVGGGESQIEAIVRYHGALRSLAGHHGGTLLVIGHAFPISFARTISSGTGRAVRCNYTLEVDYATPYEITGADLSDGLSRVSAELRRLRTRAL